jgi:hypothetical protein
MTTELNAFKKYQCPKMEPIRTIHVSPLIPKIYGEYGMGNQKNTKSRHSKGLDWFRFLSM